MVFKHKTLNLLFISGTLFLMFSTGVVCVLGQAAVADRCCVENKTSIHHENDSGTGQTPENSKPDYCCSNWYQFTTGTVKSVMTKHNLLSSPHASDSPKFICFVADQANDPTAGIEATANSRSPARPLYLAIHSLRV